MIYSCRTLREIGDTFMTITLNNRALMLYKYLLETQKATLTEIMSDLDEIYHRSEETTSKHYSSAHRQLRKDIENINKSNAQYAILPMKDKGKTYGYRLADSNEAILERAENYHQRALRYLRKEYALRKKVKNDGQLRLSRDDVKVIRSVVEE